jgi:hypothetical protein
MRGMLSERVFNGCGLDTRRRQLMRRCSYLHKYKGSAINPSIVGKLALRATHCRTYFARIGRPQKDMGPRN